MNEAASLPDRERIIITVDSTAFSDSTIEYAVTMAARLKRPLHGVFIEDTDLLSCAELPFAMEICINTGQSRTLDRGSLQSAFSSTLQRFRKRLAQLAEQNAVQWTISSARGRRRDFRLEEIEEADYCIFELGSIVRKAPRHVSRVKHLLVIDGSGEPFYRVLAGLLQPLEGNELHVTLVAGADTEGGPAPAGLLPAGTHVHHLPPQQLPATLQHARDSFDYVVVSRQRWLADLAPLLARLDCPLIVIG